MNRLQRRKAARLANPFTKGDDELEVMVRTDRLAAEQILDEISRVRKELPPDVIALAVDSFQRRLEQVNVTLKKFPLVLPAAMARRYALCLDYKATQVNGLRALGVGAH